MFGALETLVAMETQPQFKHENDTQPPPIALPWKRKAFKILISFHIILFFLNDKAIT
jgi:hypothetical protein